MGLAIYYLVTSIIGCTSLQLQTFNAWFLYPFLIYFARSLVPHIWCLPRCEGQQTPILHARRSLYCYFYQHLHPEVNDSKQRKLSLKPKTYIFYLSPPLSSTYYQGNPPPPSSPPKPQILRFILQILIHTLHNIQYQPQFSVQIPRGK